MLGGRKGSAGRLLRPNVLETTGLVERPPDAAAAAAAAAARRSVSLEFGEPSGETLGEPAGEPRGEAVNLPPKRLLTYVGATAGDRRGELEAGANEADKGVERRVAGGTNDFCWVTTEDWDEPEERWKWTR